MRAIVDGLSQKKKKGRDEEESGGEKEKREKEMLPVLEADARYHTAMESLRAKDEMSLWVQLDKCRISDKKTKKVEFNFAILLPYFLAGYVNTPSISWDFVSAPTAWQRLVEEKCVTLNPPFCPPRPSRSWRL